MAKVYVVWIQFCLISYLIFINFSQTINGENTDIYVYNLHPSLQTSFYYQIELKHLTKRDTNATTLIKQTNPVDTNRSDRPILTNSQNTVATTSISSSTENKQPSKIKLYAKDKKLLGVNGTGQRIQYDENYDTNKPIHELETHVFKNTPKLLNTTISSTTTIKNKSESIENNAELPYTKDAIDDIISEPKFAEDEEHLNETLALHNITKTKFDEDHIYYNSTFIVDPKVGQKYWSDMNSNKDVTVNELLSQSHRRAATVKLSFNFPFYGHLVRNITIATGGFLFTGEYVHSWLAATQYIAPLMANFDTSLSNHSYVKYVDNGDNFTVRWERVSLRDKPADGEFTFEATLQKNGDIIFVYKDVPVIIDSIGDEHHPVKVGLSDAYIIDSKSVYVRRKTIYEYHRINFQRENIKNWTVIYLRAAPTCLSSSRQNCISCLTNLPNFNCRWCEGVSRCSSGLDRHLQDWMNHDCNKLQVSYPAFCPANDSSKNAKKTKSSSDHSNIDIDKHRTAEEYEMVSAAEKASQVDLPKSAADSSNYGRNTTLTLMEVMFAIVIVLTFAWIVYAYKNPHTKSGQFLIRYRPSQWSWRRGEARYTAATIHM